MTTTIDQAGRSLLTTLRDALFETTPATVSKVSRAPVSGEEISDSQAALTALRRAQDPHLGPAVRELALQLEALAEILPDDRLRRQAALRVLSLKGISIQTLVLELDRALLALGAHNDAFAEKLAQRRAALEQRALAANEACKTETAAAQDAIARLQAELQAEHAKLAEASARRDEQLAACQTENSELGAKQLGFERAFISIQGEYAALKQQLCAEQL
jgi:hypothetical protein